MPHDWLTFRLTGPAHHRPRRRLGNRLLVAAARAAIATTSCELVDESIDWAGALPEVLGPDAVAGEWVGMGRQVAPGTGDNMAAALGLGLRPGDLALSLGTSGTAFTVSDEPATDPTGTVAGFADATGRFLPLVCTMNATKVTDAVARLLGVDQARFDELALEAPAGAGGLVLVPHLDGERTPNRPMRPARSPVCAPTWHRPNSPEPRWRGWCAISWREQIPSAPRPQRGRSSSSGVRRGARPTAASSPT